jgi:DNA-binding MarR family transcriptional regulator
MPVTARLELVGDAEEVLALAGRLGLKPYQNHTSTIPESDPDHTEPELVPGVDIDRLPPRQPPLLAFGPDGKIIVRHGEPEPPARIRTPPVREAAPGKRQPAPEDADGLTPGHLQALGALPDSWRTTAELAELMGRRPQGLGNQLRQLADRGLCERCEVEGKPRYRRAPAATPPAEPAEETDQTPTPLVDLPPRAAYLSLGALVGNALKVAWALHDHGELTRGQLASAVELPEDDVRETLRILIRQGYVRRDDGPPVRYALTDDVRREEAR